LEKFFHGSASYYYNVTVCFDKPDDISLISDWWVRDAPYYSIVVAIEKCKAVGNKTCANDA
jgi:hypothetical protein